MTTTTNHDPSAARSTDTTWTPTGRALPEENRLCRTISPGGQECLLRRKGQLWFFPDMKMYTYYTPGFWRYAD